MKNPWEGKRGLQARYAISRVEIPAHPSYAMKCAFRWLAEQVKAGRIHSVWGEMDKGGIQILAATTADGPPMARGAGKSLDAALIDLVLAVARHV